MSKVLLTHITIPTKIQNLMTMCLNTTNFESKKKPKKQNMNNNSSAKHFKTTYYSMLDCENNDQCNPEWIKKFEKHV